MVKFSKSGLSVLTGIAVISFFSRTAFADSALIGCNLKVNQTFPADRLQEIGSFYLSEGKILENGAKVDSGVCALDVAPAAMKDARSKGITRKNAGTCSITKAKPMEGGELLRARADLSVRIFRSADVYFFDSGKGCAFSQMYCFGNAGHGPDLLGVKGAIQPIISVVSNNARFTASQSHSGKTPPYVSKEKEKVGKEVRPSVEVNTLEHQGDAMRAN